MSVKIMGFVWDSALPSTERFVALAYADFADHTGKNVFPAIDTVADMTGFSDRTVQRCTRSLEKRGVLRDDGVHLHDPRRPDKATNRWFFDVTALPQRGDRESPRSGSGVTATTKRGDPLSPDPSIDPSNNNEGSEIDLEASLPGDPRIQQALEIAKSQKEEMSVEATKMHAVLLNICREKRRAHYPDKQLEFEKAATLLVKDGFEPEFIRREFSDDDGYWHEVSWMSKNGQAPYLSQLLDEVDNAKRWRERGGSTQDESSISPEAEAAWRTVVAWAKNPRGVALDARLKACINAIGGQDITRLNDHQFRAKKNAFIARWNELEEPHKQEQAK